MYEYAFYAYVTAVGFVVAGLMASFFQLVTGSPIKFTFVPRSGVAAAADVLTRVVAGPAIIMRNAIKAALLHGRKPYWLVLSTLISAIWSFFSGVIILELTIRLSVPS